MTKWKVDSSNRTAAKRLLNAWHDSRQVRTWTLAQITNQLRRAVNDGLMTDEGIARALGTKSKRELRDCDAERTARNERDSKSKYDSDWCEEENSNEKTDASEQHDDEQSRSDDDAQSSNDDRESNSQDDDSTTSDSDDSKSSDESSNSDSDESSDNDQSNDSDSESDDESDADSDNTSDDDSDESDNADDDESDDTSDESSDAESDDSDDDSASDDESESDDEMQSQDDNTDMDACDDCGKPYPRNELSVRESDGLAVCPDCDDQPWDGKHEMFDVVAKYIDAGLNVAMVGPAGSGKSYIARQVAKELDRDFYVNGAMMSKYDLIGYCDAHGEYHATPAHDAFVKGGVHCFDEADASAPEAMVAFNGMTDDQPFYTFPCGQRDQHPDYVAIACMNTWGNGASADYVGRFKQDAASMSRFVKVFIGYDQNVERAIAGKHTDILQRVWDLRESCELLGIRHIVSTRMIVQASQARAAKVTRKEIDRDILFSGLDEGALEQVTSQMNALKRERNKKARS